MQSQFEGLVHSPVFLSTVVQKQCYQYFSLLIRKCKGQGEVPTFSITINTFIAPKGVIFCKVVKGENVHLIFQVRTIVW